MPAIMNVHEARIHLSRLLERVRAGEEIILAKAGGPYARLVPLEDRMERVPGLVEGRPTEEFFEPLPPDALDAWGRSPHPTPAAPYP